MVVVVGTLRQGGDSNGNTLIGHRWVYLCPGTWHCRQPFVIAKVLFSIKTCVVFASMPIVNCSRLLLLMSSDLSFWVVFLFYL